jgi:hypothetical protein
MAYAIKGLNLKTIQDTDASAKEIAIYGAFPAPSTNYKTFTGTVSSVEEKTLGENCYLSIKVTNGECAGEILVSTEPEKVYQPRDEQDRQAQYQRNFETLVKAMKVLEVYNTKGELDDTKFDAAKGKLITFAAKMKGWREHNGKEYPKLGFIFNGKADVLLPISDEPIWPREASYSINGTPLRSQSNNDSDLPF